MTTWRRFPTILKQLSKWTVFEPSAQLQSRQAGRNVAFLTNWNMDTKRIFFCWSWRHTKIASNPDSLYVTHFRPKFHDSPRAADSSTKLVSLCFPVITQWASYISDTFITPWFTQADKNNIGRNYFPTTEIDVRISQFWTSIFLLQVQEKKIMGIDLCGAKRQHICLSYVPRKKGLGHLSKLAGLRSRRIHLPCLCGSNWDIRSIILIRSAQCTWDQH